MKLGTLVSWIGVVGSVFAESESNQQDVTPIGELRLQKRARGKVVNPEYQKALDALTAPAESKTTGPKPWVRTVSSTHVEIVTPTVIAGVTFSAKPTGTGGLKQWISLNKEGGPKTILPELKNGQTKKASPTYGTWFATATTITYNKQQLKAHNMADDEIFEEVQYVEEDPVEHELNPLMRCTPDSYKKKGLGKDKTTEPFCSPHDNLVLKMDQTYFITWFSGFFGQDVENVKVHLSFVRESLMHKGTRDLKETEDSVLERSVDEDAIAIRSSADNADEIVKRSAVIENGGSIGGASFHTSGWLPKGTGWFPITIDPSWFGTKNQDYYQKVLISIQPDNIEDEDFDHLKNSIVIEITKGAKVSKEHLTDLKKLDEKLAGDYEIEDGIDYAKYYVIMGMPTMVVFFALIMYIFVFINKGNTDLSHLRKRTYARAKTTKKMLTLKKKNTLPQFTGDLKAE